MKRLLELIQQQDGALCVLQASIVFGFFCFWGVWLFLSVKKQEMVDCPTGLATLLGGLLAAKIWKDITDYKNQDSSPKTDS